MKTVRTAVIGVGRMGSIHALNIYMKNAGRLRLCAICDIDEKQLKRFAFMKKVKKYTDYKALIDSGEVDAVIVAVPHYVHPEIASYSLFKGLHTLVEKPLAICESEAEKIIAASKANPDAVFMNMYNQRTNRLYYKAREIIQSGKLGELKRAVWIITDWYRSQAYYDQGGWRASWSGEGGGVLINQCVHQLDLFQWLAGMPDSVYAECRTTGRNITTENDVTALFGYRDGGVGIFIASTHDIPGSNRLELTFDGGRLLIEKNRLIFDRLNKPESTVNKTTKAGYGSTGHKRRVYFYGLLRKIKDTLNGQQRRVLKNFSRTILGLEPPTNVGEEGMAGVRLINAVYMSGWLGKRVQIPVDKNEYAELLDEHRKQEGKIIWK